MGCSRYYNTIVEIIVVIVGYFDKVIIMIKI